MRDFFSLEGPFNKYGGMLADVIILSFMWLLFSALGLGLTIGASTSALFFVTTRRIANREGYITSDFWAAFKANFKKSTLMWIGTVLLLWLIWFNISNMDVVGGIAVIIMPAQIILLVEVILISIYAFPMAARFDMSIKQILKTSFFMANRHLLTSISCLVLLATGVLSFFVIAPVALFIAPGLYGILAAYMIMRVFKKYRPEMDKDPILELQEIEAKKAEERRWRDVGVIEDDGGVGEKGEVDDVRGAESDRGTSETLESSADGNAPDIATIKAQDSSVANEQKMYIEDIGSSVEWGKYMPKQTAASSDKESENQADDFWASIEGGTDES